MKKSNAQTLNAQILATESWPNGKSNSAISCYLGRKSFQAVDTDRDYLNQTQRNIWWLLVFIGHKHAVLGWSLLHNTLYWIQLCGSGAQRWRSRIHTKAQQSPVIFFSLPKRLTIADFNQLWKGNFFCWREPWPLLPIPSQHGLDLPGKDRGRGSPRASQQHTAGAISACSITETREARRNGRSLLRFTKRTGEERAAVFAD